MGLHQGRDEADRRHLELSLSLGDVPILECPARLAYHGIDRFGSSSLLDGDRRLKKRCALRA